jgi:hypothetical protein
MFCGGIRVFSESNDGSLDHQEIGSSKRMLEVNGMAKRLEDVGSERIADHFISYLYEEYPGDMHVRRVASWVGLLVLGIDKLADRRYVPRSRQLRFEYDGRSYKAKFNHHAGTGRGLKRGGIDIVEIMDGRGSPEGNTVRSITNLAEAAAFYDDPASAFRLHQHSV